MKYTDEQVNKILAQLEDEFSSILHKSEEEAANLETQETAEEVETQEVVEETQETAEVEAEEASHDYTDEDIQEVEGLYADMDKSEAEIHWKALKKAMGEKIIEDTPAEEVEVAPVQKNETVEDKEVEELNKAELLAKDEKIAEQSDKIEKMEKTIGDLTQALGQFLGNKKTAKRKAVTGLNYQTIAKSEGSDSKEGNVDVKSLSKSEITTKLTQVSANPQTSSQDRQLINEYYCNNGSVESIGHLLK
jgi:hypothetical protein